MLELGRTVRFCLNGPQPTGAPDLPLKHNTFSAWPPMRGLGRFYQLHVTCGGNPDPATGYFINISHIDAAVRDHLLPFLESTIAGPQASADVPLGMLMLQLLNSLQQPLRHTVVRLKLELTPYHSLTIEEQDMTSLTIRQEYEFSAAHRLHVPQKSVEENRAIFGKCNNPSGHGHNYKLQAAVRVPIDPQGRVAPVEQIDAIVDQSVIQRLDHKHLNTDVPEFAKLNPSVENIAIVIHRLLKPKLQAQNLELEEVSVWETGKTVCTYRGD